MKKSNLLISCIAFIILTMFNYGCNKSEEAKIEELKSAFELTVKLYNDGEIDAYFSKIHDDVVYYIPFSKDPIEGKTAVRNMYDDMLSKLESARWEAVEPKFIVNGTTGIVWGSFKHITRSKDQSTDILIGQDTEIFTKVNGQWLKIFEHIALFPDEE